MPELALNSGRSWELISNAKKRCGPEQRTSSKKEGKKTNRISKISEGSREKEGVTFAIYGTSGLGTSKKQGAIKLVEGKIS